MKLVGGDTGYLYTLLQGYAYGALAEQPRHFGDELQLVGSNYSAREVDVDREAVYTLFFDIPDLVKACHTVFHYVSFESGPPAEAVQPQRAVRLMSLMLQPFL